MSDPSTNSDKVASLSFHALRKECTNAGLKADGNTQALRKRLLAHLAKKDEDAHRDKRQKRAVEDDLICPITLELPFDPVMAKDGQVYERSAIEQYFNGKASPVQSPFTKESMDMTLVAAPRTKNTIETLIESGVINGDLAAKWKEKEQQKKAMEELLKKAKSGDAKAMTSVAKKYCYGTDGFKEDMKMAYTWFDRADAAGSVWGTAMKGEMLLNGNGVAKDQVLGGVYLGIAAGKGSNFAAYLLGVQFANGENGFSVDKTRAIQWLKKSLSGDCIVKNLNKRGKELAQEKLDELEEQES